MIGAALDPVWLVPALVAVGGVLVLVLLRGGSARSMVVVYEPPAAIRPVEAGVLLDGRLHVDDFVAGIVDLAVRGFVTLERVPHALIGDDILVTVSRAWQADPGVRSFEITILARLYEHGRAARRLSGARADRDDLDALSHVVAADLARAGLFLVPPAQAERAARWLAVVVTAVWAQLAWNAGAPVQSYGAALATGVLLWMLGRQGPPRLLSQAGRDVRRRLLGFREFLRRAEKDRLEQLPPQTLHELLPWAIALGVLDAWADRFVERRVPAPAWYAPASPDAATLRDEMHRLRTVARGRPASRAP